MEIVNSTPEDIDTIFELYTEATNYQKAVAITHWKGFERSLVETEIRENRQWKIIEDDRVACVFVITFDDPLIWKEKDKDPAIYIHRIATNPKFRGRSFVRMIAAWAKDYALNNGKTFVRMDTDSNNDKLKDYYTNCGFSYLGVTYIGPTDDLPEHYKGKHFSLFELTV
ncbi:MAG: GNAT family N-acetyltransferase [Mucilaginibacter sp.]